MRKPEVHEHKHHSNYRSKVVMMIAVVLNDEMRHSMLGGGTSGGGEGVFLRAIAIQVTIPSIAINL